ncbi:MAG: glutamine-hydrolyzing GMP synthase [Bacteriovoracia bacterium]
MLLILDFGSQFTQLIARRLRESKVYCEIYSCNADPKKFEKLNPKGIILSGGPYSVYDKRAPKLKNPKKVLEMGVPILGICYGMQYLAKELGGVVATASTREYGRTLVEVTGDSVLFGGLPNRFNSWMSHGDEIKSLPNGFKFTARSENNSPAGMESVAKKMYAVQFHPEVVHTEHGKKMLERFAIDVCKSGQEWDLKDYLKSQIEEIRSKTNNQPTICALSGGVDSTVAATLVSKAIGNKLHCVFVNTGMLRKDEAKTVLDSYRKELHLNLHYVDAEKVFLRLLKGVTDPEKKRKIIGKTFIRLFEAESKKIAKKLKLKEFRFLVQGTLYPDVIESLPPPKEKQKGAGIGFSSKIKSHHNVGGLPKNFKFKLVEPLRELFKDEVRKLGRELEIPEKFLSRHPFPGPGLAVRILGDITKQRLDLLREVDAVFINEIKKQGLYDEIWQAFAVYLPVKTVGVMGDGRSFENVIALRAVTSQDGMTADWYRFSSEFLDTVSRKIIGTVAGVNRVVYDISSKPPATIEWE